VHRWPLQRLTAVHLRRHVLLEVMFPHLVRHATPFQLCQLALVCRALHRLACDEGLWRSFFLRVHPKIGGVLVQLGRAQWRNNFCRLFAPPWRCGLYAALCLFDSSAGADRPSVHAWRLCWSRLHKACAMSGKR
jgi:hypothetical protein